MEIRELEQFLSWAVQHGARRILINGSFVTDAAAPNDVDVIVLPGGEMPHMMEVVGTSDVLWPFLQVLIAADDTDFEAWASQDFGTDRTGRPKGVVELIL